MLVYIREAHPVDGWKMEENEQEGIKVLDPKTLVERQTVARTACAQLHIDFPTVVDNLDNKVGAAYSGWPDRWYVVGKDGKIGYKSSPGPWGFDTVALATYLNNNFGPPKP